MVVVVVMEAWVEPTHATAHTDSAPTAEAAVVLVGVAVGGVLHVQQLQSQLIAMHVHALTPFLPALAPTLIRRAVQCCVAAVQI